MQKKYKTIGLIVFLVICIFIFIFNNINNLGLSKNEIVATKSIKTLKSKLLVPDSLILYETYVSHKWSKNSASTLIYFSAKTKSGRISDNWVLINDNIYFENSLSDIKNLISDKNLNEADDQLTSTLYVQTCKEQINMNSSSWGKVDVDKIKK